MDVATGVRTDKGDIAAEIVVNCAGQWARQVGLMCGVSVPLHSAEHMYIVTGKIEGVHPDLPVMRDPDGYIYFKEEVGGLVMGGFEPHAKPWGMNGIPENFEFALLPDDWDQFEILMENALIRVPQLEQAEVKQFYNGPESFTPDNNFLLGEAPELKNFFVGAGFNSMGIASAGGAGKALAEWIVNGAADHGSVAGRYPPLRRLQQQSELAARPREGNARPALCDALAEPRTRHRTAIPPFASV